MKNKYDDLINKYVDNELTNNEITKVEQLVNSDENFSLNLTTHKYVHDSLPYIPQLTARKNIADSIMKQIIGKLSDRYNKNYFFRAIVFAFFCILVTALYMLFFYGNNLPIVKESVNVIDYLTTYTQPVIKFIYKIISTDMFKTVSGLLGFIVLVVFYFTFNSHKELKERLKQF